MAAAPPPPPSAGCACAAPAPEAPPAAARPRRRAAGAARRAAARAAAGRARGRAAAAAGSPSRGRAPASRAPCPSVEASSSSRTGTAISAAAVGVGARRSAAKSISVVSVSCPTAEISGIALSAAARTTISSLNPQRSSRHPPPRATISRSGRGIGPPGASALNPRIAAATSGAQSCALHRHRPDQHMARKPVAQPVQDIADHRARRRGDDADHLAADTGSAACAPRRTALRPPARLALLQHRHQRADARPGPCRRRSSGISTGRERSSAAPWRRPRAPPRAAPAAAPTCPFQQIAASTARSSLRSK